jgi:hypothetical protein
MDMVLQQGQRQSILHQWRANQILQQSKRMVMHNIDNNVVPANMGGSLIIHLPIWNANISHRAIVE